MIQRKVMPTIRNRMTPEQIERVRELHDRGLDLHAIAAEVGQNIRWVAIRLYASGVVSQAEQEKKAAVSRRLQVAKVEASKPKPVKRRCIGDLNESVDKAYQRVCGGP